MLMKIALAQINPIVGHLKYNFQKILKEYKKALDEKADLLILPELALLGYPPKDLLLKQSLLADLQLYSEELASYTKGQGCAVVLGTVTENQGYGKKLFNSLLFIEDGEIKAQANKSLLPNYDVFDETRYFEPSPQVCVYEYKSVKLGLSICEDMWIEAYPSMYLKDPIGALMGHGAQILINSSASPFSISKPATREKLIKSICARNKTPVIYLNQVGANDELIFDGNSMVFDTAAELRYKLKSFEEDFLLCDVDDLFSAQSEDQVCEPQIVAEMEDVYNALVLGLRDYISKTGFSKVLLGLSGGIDSALVLALAVEAVGAKNVFAAMLPSEFTSQSSHDDAAALIKNLKIPEENYRCLSIDVLRKEMQTLIPKMSDLALENIQPRLRATLLMAISNTSGAILLNTGNKSEIAVGYSTLYGDSCGALSVIGDLLKGQVYQLAEFINRDAEIIPLNILKKAPSAELRTGQKDSDSLPDYEVLDQIVMHYVQEMQSVAQIVTQTGFDKDLVKKVVAMIDRAEYKRRQLPPVLKIAGKTFGQGRRMPIVQGYS